MKLVIFGSRNAYPSHEQIDAALVKVRYEAEFVKHEHGVYDGLTAKDITTVVCGMARGADDCGLQWAAHHKIGVKAFPAEWDRYGKRAGFMRNKAMAEYADIGIGFWKDESPGTANMATQLVVLGKPVRVVRV